MSNLKKMDDEALDQVSGGYIEVGNTVYDPRKNNVNVNNAIMDDNTVVTGKLLAGEAKVTGAKGDPLKKPLDPFGTNLNAGSGLA